MEWILAGAGARVILAFILRHWRPALAAVALAIAVMALAGCGHAPGTSFAQWQLDRYHETLRAEGAAEGAAPVRGANLATVWATQDLGAAIQGRPVLPWAAPVVVMVAP